MASFKGLVGNGGYSLVRIKDSLYTAIWNGSSWDYYVRDLYMDALPPAASTFIQANWSTTTVDESAGGILLTTPTGSGANLRVLYTNTPATPYSLTVFVIPYLAGITTKPESVSFV